MIITAIILILLVGGIIGWQLENKKQESARIIALLTVVLASMVFIVYLFSSSNQWQDLIVLTRLSWISVFNIEYAIALDNLSIVLILLTLLLAVIAILVSWREIRSAVGFYYFNILATIAGIIGVFTAVDLFLFFFFWEVMLLPMTALIAIWGHENRHYAAIKFFIFTQLSSLLMLVAIIAMALIALQQTGQLSFYYLDWLKLSLPLSSAKFIMLGFFIAFAVKLPSIPVHSWLPDAHTQAPTAGSVLLAGVLLKTGAYGLIRFVIFLFPEASQWFAPTAVILAVVSILYGAKLAFAQQDIKRLIAYSSISHMGFVMLALFSFNHIAYQGAVMTMIAHGLSSAALFALAGMVYIRAHTRDITAMGGYWQSAPRLGGFALAFAAAAFGLPGLANFIGEFLSLVGAYQQHPKAVIFAAVGIIGSAVYGMKLFQDSFQGPIKTQVMELSIREFIILLCLLVCLIIFGIYPNLILSQFADGANVASTTLNTDFVIYSAEVIKELSV